ncbi:MAG: hypothetical protein HDT40_02750 [Lachnospiraceae bacterium]|nr:hypothetical protein [Lachnospiraceae bacterium]
MKRIKSTALISTLLMLIGVFSACGKSDKEDIARDLSEDVTSDSATKSDAVQEEIPESLSYTVGAGGSGAIKVEAEIYSEGYGQVPTYKLKKRDKNGQWVMSYAEKLFDNGEYINVKPYDFCSMEELEAEKQFWEERLRDLDESSIAYGRVESQLYDIENIMEHFSESNYAKYAEGQIIFKKSSSGDEDNLTSYSERAQLRGEVDGNVWLLNYDYRVNEYMLYQNGRELGWGIFPPVLYGSCVEKMDYISSYYGMDVGIYKNKCNREQAESEAEKLLDRLGFNNMECVKMAELKPNQATDYCDGYCIIYGPSYGINMFSFTGVGASADGETIAVQPYVCVLVNSGGAYSFCILEDYDVEEKLSENSQVLSFQQIDSIAHTEFEKKMEEHPNVSYDITKVKFEYLCVTYDGIDYAMIPVWIYYTEWINHGDTNLLPVLIVNALDGAVIPIEPVYFNWEYSFIWGYYIIAS